MPTIEQKLAAVHGYIDGFDKGDVEAIVALFAEDATIEDPLGTPIMHGQGPIREFYTGSVTAGAKLELQGDPRCAGDYVAFAFAAKLEWDGQKTRIEVIDTFKLNDDGKITEMRAYWGPENMKAG
jgi:steroid Delta-isomerase